MSRPVLTLAIACLVAAPTGALPAWAATILLVLLAVLFTLGEIWGESGRWGLRYELAPHHATGQYGGVFATGDAVGTIAGPALVTTVPDRFGAVGWLLLALIFVIGLPLSAAAVRWAVRTRQPQPEEELPEALPADDSLPGNLEDAEVPGGGQE